MREVIRGCAGEVMVERLLSDIGRVVRFGKRIGEIKGLYNVSEYCKCVDPR